MALLEIKNLHVSVGNREILKGVSLTLNGGEVHAIMGPNGAGKSTLLKILMDLEYPDDGHITKKQQLKVAH